MKLRGFLGWNRLEAGQWRWTFYLLPLFGGSDLDHALRAVFEVCRVFVSRNNPSTIVQPSAPNEDKGAGFGVPSSFAEQTIVTGIPK